MEGFQPVRLAYNTHEPVGGADERLSPIVYLHGMTAAKEYWTDIPQIVANATKRRSYSVDARNHGDSEWCDNFNFDQNSDDLIHFLDNLGIQKAILVGHSMGGITAIRTALKKPDRVERVVIEDMLVRKISKYLVNAVLPWMTVQHEALEKAPAGLDKIGIRTFVFQYLKDNLPPELMKYVEAWDPEQPANNFCYLKRDANGRYALKCNVKVILKAMSDPETLYSEPEGMFDGPSLFIYGTRSPFKVGSDEQHIKQFFPKVVLVGIDADHSIHVSSPAAFTDSLLKFLA